MLPNVSVRPLFWPLIGAFPFIICIYLCLPQIIFPAEDAAILFRYSENLAQSGVISYNPEGEPAEGATDFLWMLLLALGVKLGIPVYGFSLFVSAVSFVGSYLIGYKWLDLDRHKAFYAWFWLFALLLSSQTLAAVQGFSVVFFGFFILLTGWFYMQGKWPHLVISACLLALARPEGLLIAAPMVLGSLVLEKRNIRKKIRILFILGILPGLSYFLWRYDYFGLLFPLSFYVKTRNLGEGNWFVEESLLYLLTYLGRYLFPLWMGVLLMLGQQREWLDRRVLPFLLGVFFFPLLFYSTVELAQNVAHRFAYPLLLACLLVFLMVKMPPKFSKVVMAIYILLSACYFFIYLNRTLPAAYNNTPVLAVELKTFEAKRMAVTEAGRLPYYAGWETLDLWGLNTPALSREIPQAGDLMAFDPDLIVLDDGEWLIEEMKADLTNNYYSEKNWDYMVFNSFKYAMESGIYEAWWVPFQRNTYLADVEKPWISKLAAVYSAFTGHEPDEWKGRYDLYLLKKDQPEVEELRRLIHQFGGKKDDHLLDRL